MCSRIVKETRGQPKHIYGRPVAYPAIPERHTAATRPSRMVLSSRIVTDHHGRFEPPKTAVWETGAPTTFPNVPGPTRINMAATRLKCRKKPDMNCVIPASVWDLGNTALLLACK
ncbi:hypothetical protein DPMN_132317 [Dreissena polymorpha]|uniref:Uncharacterized protein n=1 Tax=Dreissena polymorpha TaxID=45954 RepID=A0A9D4FVW5_DREPO|nr:hypothetical protein DPMN_132317 [Dreissena polymorpha]